MTERTKVAAAHEVAAVGALPVVSGEELVAEVAVTRLHVDEIEPGLLGQAGPIDELGHELVELDIAEDRVVARAHPGIEQRVAIQRAGGRAVSGRPGVATGVGQLEHGDLRGIEDGPKRGDVVDRRLVENELVGVGPPVGPHRGRFPPHQPRTTAAANRSHRRRTSCEGRPSGSPSHPSIGRTAHRLGATLVPATPSVMGSGAASTPAGSTSASTGSSISNSSRRARSFSSVSSFLTCG